MRFGFSTKVGKKSRVYVAPGGGKKSGGKGSGGVWLVIGGLVVLGCLIALLKNHPWLWFVLLAAAVALIVRAILKKKQRKAEEQAAVDAAVKNMEIEEKKAELVAGLKETAAGMDWDYVYERVGIYRPEGAVDELPNVGDLVMFEFEPENPYDSEAVRAVKLGGGKIGYMYRKGNMRNMVTDFLKNDWSIYAEVTKAEPDRLEVLIKLKR